LKLRVKRLEKKGGSRIHKFKILFKVGRSTRVISSDEASLGVFDDEGVSTRQDMAKKEVITADPVTTAGEVVTTASVEDKGKAKMIEPKKPLKKKDQIMFDEEVAQRLQAQLQEELEEEERLARQKEEEAVRYE
ncbi:hypothetical protein Tco_0741064, partial [Tanacetum coccineum]